MHKLDFVTERVTLPSTY
ncbi:hypothetical protein LINPERPRIM_LOCUS37625 [Linum perenne]